MYYEDKLGVLLHKKKLIDFTIVRITAHHKCICVFVCLIVYLFVFHFRRPCECASPLIPACVCVCHPHALVHRREREETYTKIHLITFFIYLWCNKITSLVLKHSNHRHNFTNDLMIELVYLCHMTNLCCMVCVCFFCCCCSLLSQFGFISFVCLVEHFLEWSLYALWKWWNLILSFFSPHWRILIFLN